MWNKKLNLFSFYTSLIAVVIMIITTGFFDKFLFHSQVIYFYDLSFILTLFNILYYNFYKKSPHTRKIWPLEILVTISILVYYLARFEYHFSPTRTFQFFNLRLLYVLIVLCFIRDFSSLNINLKRTFINPAQLFILSFFGIILIGTALLMMPNATVNGIKPLDALFTATSAVCVTGLIVLDTAKDFTLFGKIIIISLIQIGGLGIMTFASYFSYFFRGGSSYENQISLGEMTSSNKLGEVFSTLKRVIIITVIIEALGAIFIYSTLDLSLLNGSVNRGIFFSIFHAISAFCNAGFSTLSGNLYEPGYQFNYGLHFTVASLFIFGGLGFPIVYNVYKYVKHLLKNFFRTVLSKEKFHYTPWIINLNSRIILATTSILLIFGTVTIYFFEKNGALREHSVLGKWIEAFLSRQTIEPPVLIQLT